MKKRASKLNPMHPATFAGFADELTKMAAKGSVIKSNDRMPAKTKANISALVNHVETWESPHREEALKFVQKVTPGGLFDIMHSIRRWYTGQTMGHTLLTHQDSLKSVMKLDPEDVQGVYRGFKVENDNPLAKSKPGEELVLPVTRNRGLSSWSTSEAATNRFSGGGKGKTGLIVKLVGTDGVKPILAPPSHSEGWFNALYERTIGRSFRPTEGEYLIHAPSVKVEVVRVKK